MKKLIILVAAILMMAVFTTTVMAQTNTEASVAATPAGAVLLVAMTLDQTSPLHFGSMVLINADGGTCVLNTANERTFAAAGVKGSLATPTSTNAAYNVTGTINETYALTLPASTIVTLTTSSSGVKTMAITDMKVLFLGGSEQTYLGATSTLSATGTDSFIVGGTLTVKPAQVEGIYAGTFKVTVDYN